MIAYSLSRAAGADVGEYAITASGAAEQGNYNVEFANGKLTITAKAATVTVDDKTKVYGDAEPALTAAVSGTVGEDTINYTLERAAGADVGTYAITATLGSNPNYNVTVENGEFTITPATAYILPTGELNGSFLKYYGEEDPALTAIAFDSRDKDMKDITGTIKYTITRESGKNVGDYKLIFNFEEEQGNYIVMKPTKDFYLGIKPAELTVVVKDASKVYGEADPAFTGDVTGLAKGETAADAKIVYSRTEAAKGKEDAGTYADAITAAILAEDSNYVLAKVTNGDLVIKPMDVTVTVSDAAMVYGGDAPVPMAAVKDAKGNAVTGLDISFKAYKVVNGAASDEEIAIEDLANADAGSYIIKAVLDNSNYNVVSYVDGKLTIAPKTIYIDFNDEPITIIEGEAMPEDIAYTLSDENGAITGNALAALIEDIKPAINVMDGDIVIDVEAADPGEYVITADTANGNYLLVVRTEGVLVMEKHAGRIIDAGRTLTLDGVIYIEQYVTVEGFDDIDVAANGGMLIWDKNATGELTEAEAVVGHALAQNKEGLNDLGTEFHQRTDGIVTKKYADEVYLRTYVKIGKDRYVYGPLKEFSVQIYCEGRINKNGREKDVCIAMLHLGAEAQKYFKYGLDDLANANIKDLYPSKDYDISMVDALNMDYSYDFAVSDKVIDNGKTLSLEGAVLIDAFYQFEGEVASAELLAWKEVSGKLDIADAIVSKMELENGEYHGRSPMFASKRYGDTVYICARFTDTNGNVYYSEVDAFSPDYYCQRRIDRASREEEVAKKMVIYSEEARAYFKY